MGVGAFKKLMSALVESTMLYGVEIRGCITKLEAIQHYSCMLSACSLGWAPYIRTFH